MPVDMAENFVKRNARQPTVGNFRHGSNGQLLRMYSCVPMPVKDTEEEKERRSRKSRKKVEKGGKKLNGRMFDIK